MDAVSRKELAEKVLIHLYNSAVSGSVKSTALAVGMRETAWVKNPRFKDLRALYELAGKDRRLFYSGTAAIAEFAAYRVLDFVGMYNRFDAQHNKDAFPHVSLVYTSAAPEGLQSVTLSEYGSEELGKTFLRIARSDEMRSFVESVINELSVKNPATGKEDEPKKD